MSPHAILHTGAYRHRVKARFAEVLFRGARSEVAPSGRTPRPQRVVKEHVRARRSLRERKLLDGTLAESTLAPWGG
jgi:hypothetical protein